MEHLLANMRMIKIRHRTSNDTIGTINKYITEHVTDIIKKGEKYKMRRH